MPTFSLSSILSFFPLLLPLTTAVPSAGPGLPGAVYVCPNAGFAGPNCAWIPPTTECHINGGLKSIGPDQGGYCRLFKDQTCGGQAGNWIKEVYWPGISIAAEGNAFGSMRCRPTVCTAAAEGAGCPTVVG